MRERESERERKSEGGAEREGGRVGDGGWNDPAESNIDLTLGEGVSQNTFYLVECHALPGGMGGMAGGCGDWGR